jgi:formamidopyrimidine-DNA glycosylase
MILSGIIIDAYPTSNGRYGRNVPECHKDFMEGIKYGQCRVDNIQVKGKFMYWIFSNGWYMFCTFGMTGQWSPTRGKHPCFIFQHAPSLNRVRKYQELVFNDPRHFGTIKFTNNPAELNSKLSELGWDPLARTFESYKGFITDQLKYSRKCIGEILMNQRVFAGVGNYIRAEALYEAKISPWRAANLLGPEEITHLCKAIVHVMQESYDHQGATILTYKDAYGAEGKYSSCFKVYGQKQDPLGHQIKKENTPDGRSIHWCPTIQI